MDGMHDLGGMQGFGAVSREADEPVFHAPWEARMFAIATAVPFAVPFSDDHFRREIERMDPVHYLISSYYEKWYHTIMAQLARRPAVGRPLASDAVLEAIAAGASQARSGGPHVPHRFRTGDRVRTRSTMHSGHHRLPRYARGRVGRIEAERGAFLLADAHAERSAQEPQALYTVLFEARELWGEEADPRDLVSLDLWDSYLEPA
jgi:nitrile hydratase subunit beta